MIANKMESRLKVACLFLYHNLQETVMFSEGGEEFYLSLYGPSRSAF
jgi:hypothetical protein